MEKIPCIKCTPEIWEYIKPYLKEWGYELRITSGWNAYPLLIINECGTLGRCNNYSLSAKDEYNRELVANIEEFLERAAKLKGFEYGSDIVKINGVTIKPGMYLCGKDKHTNYIILVAFPFKDKIAFTPVAGVNSSYSWSTDYNYFIKDIEEIRDVSNGYSITNGESLWEKSREVVITMDEIAEKFGCPVNVIKIKK